MTECKHRWEENAFIKSNNPNRYRYQCTRCGNRITTLLKDKT